MHLTPFFAEVADWSVKSGIPIFIVLILMIVSLRIIKIFTKEYFEKIIKTNGDTELEKRSQTLKSIVKSTLNIVVITISALIILDKLGIQIGPILAAAGVVGIAVGFGAQRLVEDLICGFIILLEDQIRVGDVVEVAGKSGLVEKIDLKMVVLRDIAGNVHYIRNGKIDTITNMTRDYSRYVFDIGIAYRENVDEVIKIIQQVDEDLRNDEVFGVDILEPIEILGLDKFDSSAVVIKARTKTQPIKQWGVAREFNRRLKNKFDELGIEMPFPHRTIYI
jgi:small-conductance mechanosensitive channel